MRHSLSRAVKCAIQAQIAAVGGLTQLRRDHYLSAAKGLSVDDLRELRHSPILGLLTLFLSACSGSSTSSDAYPSLDSPVLRVF